MDRCIAFSKIFAVAIELFCGDAVTGSTTGQPNRGGRPAPDVLYEFTFNDSSSPTEFIFSTCSVSTNYDSYLEIYDDFALTSRRFFDDDGCGGISVPAIITGALPNGTYYLLVDGFGSGDSGTYALDFSCPGLFLGHVSNHETPLKHPAHIHFMEKESFPRRKKSFPRQHLPSDRKLAFGDQSEKIKDWIGWTF